MEDKKRSAPRLKGNQSMSAMDTPTLAGRQLGKLLVVVSPQSTVNPVGTLLLKERSFSRYRPNHS